MGPKSQLLFALPIYQSPEHAPVQVWKDVSTRITSCYECHRPIPKRSRRIKIIVRRSNARYTAAAGTRYIPKDTLFFHPKCISDLVKGPPSERIRRCVDCGKGADGRDSAYINRRYTFGHVCDICRESGRWMKCGYCTIWYPTYMIERIVRDGPKPLWACQFCAVRRELYTATQEKKDNRLFDVYRNRVLKALKRNA